MCSSCSGGSPNKIMPGAIGVSFDLTHAYQGPIGNLLVRILL